MGKRKKLARARAELATARRDGFDLGARVTRARALCAEANRTHERFPGRGEFALVRVDHVLRLLAGGDL